MTSKVVVLLDAVIAGAPAAELADHLAEQGHSDAPIVRHMSSPVEIAKLLIGNGLTVAETLDLKLPSGVKVDLILHRQHFSADAFSRLACEFAERVLPIFEEWNPHDERPRFAIELSRRWQTGAVSDKDLYDACHATKYAAQQARIAGNTLAAFSANAAGAASDEGGDARDASYFAHLAGGDVELDWQVERIRTGLASQ